MEIAYPPTKVSIKNMPTTTPMKENAITLITISGWAYERNWAARIPKIASTATPKLVVFELAVSKNTSTSIVSPARTEKCAI